MTLFSHSFVTKTPCKCSCHICVLGLVSEGLLPPAATYVVGVRGLVSEGLLPHVQAGVRL